MSSVPGIDLANRVIIITGAAQGQGEVEAAHFADLGAHVYMADIKDEAGEAIAQRIGATYVHTDIASEGDWAHLMGRVMSDHGRLDALVNNASIYWVRTIEEENVEDFNRLLTTNVGGTFLGIKAAVEPMMAAGGGSIVNVASIAGTRGLERHVAYGSSKWAMRGLSKVAATELGPKGIRVNIILPGIIDTPMSWGGGTKPVISTFDHIPLQRVGTADDVAGLVAFLVSDASGYLSGAEITVDGGATVGIPRTN
jgi:3alpha(or 20beta)-hydroxysteroid dehydrogenase